MQYNFSCVCDRDFASKAAALEDKILTPLHLLIIFFWRPRRISPFSAKTFLTCHRALEEELFLWVKETPLLFCHSQLFLTEVKHRELFESSDSANCQISFLLQVKWFDSYGGHGEHYWDYNHGPSHQPYGYH